MTVSNAPAIHLLDRRGSEVAVFVLAGKTTFRIGRSDGCDIRLPESAVSRQHAMVQIESGGRCNLIDLGSANGTFLNGQRVAAPAWLHPGDRIEIGGNMLVFMQEREEAHRPRPQDWDADEKTVAAVNLRPVTLLVADIVNFTPLAERLGDRGTGELMQVWSGAVREIVATHFGMVDKFIGDAVMALWLEENDRRRSVLRALQSALAIQRTTALLHEKIPAIPWPLACRAAVNSGEAMAGAIADRGFTVIGDTVNVTFRLEETAAQQGADLMLGAAALDLLEESGRVFPRKKYFLKGKGEQVEAGSASWQQLGAALGKW
ncbi:MAG: adenylate/guanylate cyclase domain-containing protein [Thermodesulfobacteriota bacterium]